MKKLKKLLVGLGVFALVTVCAPPRAWPTVSNTTVQTVTANGNGSNTNFSISFDFRSNSWIAVTLVDTSTSPATSTAISQGAGAGKFTVSGGNPGTTVVMGTAPTTSQYLVIQRNIPLTQPVVFNPASVFPYQGLSSQMDQITLTLQNLNANIGGSGGGSGGSVAGLPSPGAAYDFIAWNSAGTSTVNATVAYDAGHATFQTGDILKFTGTGWGTYLLNAANLMTTLNSGSSGALGVSSGGTGTVNTGGSLAWGTNQITLNTTGTTSITLPTSGTLLVGPADNNNTASAIVKRDSSGNFSAGTVTANTVGTHTGPVVGNVTGSTSGTAANVTGVVALGNGGTGQTTAQSAINTLLNSSAGSAGNFARYNGTNVSLSPILIGDVPTGFARSKLAQGTANTIVTNDGSGNLFDLAGGAAGNCVQFNGISWVSAACGGGPLVGVTYYGVDTGTPNAFVVTTSSSPGGYVPGVLISFLASTSNTGASTINLDGLGSVNLMKTILGVPTALASGDLPAGSLIDATYDGTEFLITSGVGTLYLTGAQTVAGTKTFSSPIAGSITGNAATVTTNANLTGPITSVGNATSVAAQTGTGSTFVMQASPTLTTPVIGAATGTSLSVSGQLTSTVATGTAPLAVSSTTQVANLNAATAGTATNATNGATVSTSSNASFFPLFAASSSNGNQPFNLGTGLTFNPSTNNLTSTLFTGANNATAGAVGTPSVYFGTSNTGFYGASSTSIGVSVAGSNVATFTSAGVNLGSATTTAALTVKNLLNTSSGLAQFQNSAGTKTWSLDNASGDYGATGFALVDPNGNAEMVFGGNNVTGVSLGLNVAAAQYQWDFLSSISPANPTLLSQIVPNSASFNLPFLMLGSTNSTANGIEGFCTENGSHHPLMCLGSRQTTATSGSEVAGAWLGTQNAGTLTEWLTLSSLGVLQLEHYGTGLLHSDSSGNIMSSTVATADIAANAVTAAKIASGVAAAGTVATADGAGNTSFLAPAVAPVLVAPAIQVLTSGTTFNEPYAFIITSGSATAASTYTNNSVTFTTLYTVASGTLVYMTGSNVPLASGTLTKASGTGDATLTFSAYKAPLYLDVELVGGGGGGAGGGSGSPGNGGDGTGTTFSSGASLVSGTAGLGAVGSVGGAGGVGSVGSGLTGTGALFNGQRGQGGSSSTGALLAGGNGCSSPFGNGGGGGSGNGPTAGAGGGPGAGGGGGGSATAAGFSGAGGGCAGYAKAMISAPALTYAYVVGTAGSAGGAGTLGSAGGAAGAGYIVTRANYQ